jgi:hypothetical protein
VVARHILSLFHRDRRCLSDNRKGRMVLVESRAAGAAAETPFGASPTPSTPGEESWAEGKNPLTPFTHFATAGA